MSEITKPDFAYDDESADWLYCKEVNYWFNENIKGKHFYDPKDAVEVFLRRRIKGSPHMLIATTDQCSWDTDKALLINITPIKHWWECPCGEKAMFAETEDCKTPLCHECSIQIKTAMERNK